MKTNRASMILIVVVLLAAGLACKQNVPGAVPKATTAPGTEQALSTSPTDVMNQIYVFATQTAMVEQGLGTTPQPPAAETPQPASEVPPQAATPASVDTAQPGLINPQQPAQPAQVNPAQPIPPLVVPASYTLQKNEYPFCIARRFNIDPAELLRLNGLSSYSVYSSGLALRIPQTGRTFPGNRALLPHPSTHTVGPNDTIFSIACAFGDVDPMAIAAVNGLQAPYRLSPGQTLQIP